MQGFNQPLMENSIFGFPTVDSQPWFPNCGSKIPFSIPVVESADVKGQLWSQKLYMNFLTAWRVGTHNFSVVEGSAEIPLLWALFLMT